MKLMYCQVFFWAAMTMCLDVFGGGIIFALLNPSVRLKRTDSVHGFEPYHNPMVILPLKTNFGTNRSGAIMALSNPISLFSQSLFALPLYDMIAATPKAGYEAIELACRAPHFDPHTAKKEPERVVEAIRLSELTVSALSLFSSFTDPDRLEDEIKAAERLIRQAPLFGTKIVKITPGEPGSAAATEAQWDSLRQALGRLVPVAADTGVKLACETHMRQLTDTLAGTLRLLDMAPSETLGLTIDFSNMTFAGEIMSEVFDALVPRMLNAHVKNGTIGDGDVWHFKPLDTGWTDYNEVMRLIHASGYTGYLTVECLGQDAKEMPIKTAQRDLEMLKEFMKLAVI